MQPYMYMSTVKPNISYVRSYNCYGDTHCYGDTRSYIQIYQHDIQNNYVKKNVQFYQMSAIATYVFTLHKLHVVCS